MRLNLGPFSKACCGLSIVMCAATLAGCDHVRQGGVIQTAQFHKKPEPRRAEPKAKAAPRTHTLSKVSVPMPDRSLLMSAAEPDCEFRTTDPNADEWQKLDYERQCYRHAELIARDRLKRLQDSVRRTARAIDHCELSALSLDELEPFRMAEQ
jgi:hypothetical protein